MLAATNKTDLLAVTEKEFAKLVPLLDDLGADLIPHSFDDGWSIKDVIALRTIAPLRNLSGRLRVWAG
ncbi:hypothetical protein SAMN05444000_11086 [Shimia gijangensis]|uniref:Uncharacterized protein n=1 Tax=Shimia gijangensis TaxID=1470563 RepID=A0A1M6KFF0_9RHOB|nr:hypothetical protein [Shimia gijangensis]SHJ57620.1 hypothetical protein SAMN05444000_11086 [Shimia gijangensis]